MIYCTNASVADTGVAHYVPIYTGKPRSLVWNCMRGVSSFNVTCTSETHSLREEVKGGLGWGRERNCMGVEADTVSIGSC